VADGRAARCPQDCQAPSFRLMSDVVRLRILSLLWGRSARARLPSKLFFRAFPEVTSLKTWRRPHFALVAVDSMLVLTMSVQSTESTYVKSEYCWIF
jgi:hypothetical protein